jgi:hypothetical protein
MLDEWYERVGCAPRRQAISCTIRTLGQREFHIPIRYLRNVERHQPLIPFIYTCKASPG